MKAGMPVNRRLAAMGPLLLCAGLLGCGGWMRAGDAGPDARRGFERRLTLMAAAEIDGGVVASPRLLYEQAFRETDALLDFTMTDRGAWRIALSERGRALELFGQSRYQPPVRSPVNMALIKDKVFGDFVLECDVIQTGREYGHRDMCFFFGFESPSKFYYAHLATAADDHAHNIFVVNDKPRTKIALETTKGVDWGLNVWHKVRLERTPADGSIKVFFDDMQKPIMVASDRTFGAGYVGFGSFDDTGMVANVRIWGPSMETREGPVFPAAAP
jgi:hypothetical protein